MEKNLVLKNETGLHARPAGVLVKTASQFVSQIEIKTPSKTANAKSIMALLSLGLEQGTEFTLIANGPDAPEAVEKICALIENGFN